MDKTIDEELLKQMVIKLLSFMTDEQLIQVSAWLKEMNLKIEDLSK